MCVRPSCRSCLHAHFRFGTDRRCPWLLVCFAAVAKQEDLLSKYAELKASGQLEAFMTKRRAKLARKDHVHMPHQRRAQDDA
jgi:hypothetical protein